MPTAQNTEPPPTPGGSPDSGEKGKRKASGIAERLMHLLMTDPLPGIVYWQGSLYHWDKGRYYEVLKCEEEAFAAALFYNEGVPATSSSLRDVLLNLKASAHIRSQVPLNSWLRGAGQPQVVVAQNGNICLDQCDAAGHPVLLAHTHDYFTMSNLPYAYDPQATCPRWLRFLEEVMEGDADRIRLLQQWAGYLFTPDLRQQKFMLHYGSGGNGKGVYSRMMEELVGLKNCSHVPLSRFRAPFEFSATLGKWLNTSGETTKFVGEQGEAILKAYTAGDRMMFERKYRDPVEAIPTAKLMLFTNALPQFHDRSEGIWRRMLVVPWRVEIPYERQNRNLVNELKEELPGIFNWAYAGLRSLDQGGGFVEPSVCREALRQYRTEICPAETFLRENYYECPPGGAVDCGDVYHRYLQWCSEYGFSPVEQRVFGRKVYRTFPRVQKSRLGSREDRVNYYVGIRPKDGSAGGPCHINHNNLAT
jgi:putative DNA primase/helicase